MEKPIIFIKEEIWGKYQKFVDDNKSQFVGDGDVIYKGVVLLPSSDDSTPCVFYLNPVFGKAGTEDGDIMIQRSTDPTCPYPPGY